MATEHSVSHVRDFVIGIAQSVAAIALGIIALRIVPQCEWTFKDFGVELPEMTMHTIRLSHFLDLYWHLLVLPVLVWPFVNWGIASVLSPRPEVVIPRRVWYCMTWGAMFLIVVFIGIALLVPLITLHERLS